MVLVWSNEGTATSSMQADTRNNEVLCTVLASEARDLRSVGTEVCFHSRLHSSM